MKSFPIFLVGFLGGAIAGWYGTKKYYKTKCEMETQNMRKLCEETLTEANQKVQNAEIKAQRAADDRQVYAQALNRTLTNMGYNASSPDPVEAELSNAEKTAHPSENDDYHSDPSELDVPTEQELQRIDQKRKRLPMLIDEETYSTDIYSGYEKKEVNWYPEDQMLLDGDTYELMDDPYSFLGQDWLAVIERDGEAYVRNFRWEVDYWITSCTGLGVDNMSVST